MNTESKCSCKHCGEHIAFPTEMAGQMFDCPHCGLKIKLNVPKTGFAFAMCVIVVCLVIALIAFAIARLTVKEWPKSDTIRQGDIQVEVQFLGFGMCSPQRTFAIIIFVHNLSNTKKYDFKTWRGLDSGTGGDVASLTDNFGNHYKLESLDPSYANEEAIYPNTGTTDHVGFEKPVTNIKWLHLELPAKNFGGSGVLRFEISESEIGHRNGF